MTNSQSQTNYKINPLVKGVMDENNPLMLEVLNRLIYFSHRHSRVFVSQGTLAASLGISLKWVNRLLARWKEMGVLCYRQQGFNRSCLYIINPLLFQERERLKWKLSALKLLLHVSALCSGLFGEEFLLSNIRNIFNKKYNRFPLLQYRNDEHSGYHFYEKGYGEKQIIPLFLNNQSITIEKQQLCLKESVMNPQTIISVIAQAYNLSIENQEQLSRHSFEALEYARKELYRQGKQRSLTNATSATNWFSAVATAFEKKALRFPKKGNDAEYSTKQRPTGGHSPAGDQSNLSLEERIEYAMDQESEWKQIDQPTAIMEQLGFHMGYVDRAQSNWKRIVQNPKEFPTSSNSFKDTIAAGEQYTEGPDYEEHLNQISADKTDPEAYKRRIRITDYRRIARK